MVKRVASIALFSLFILAMIPATSAAITVTPDVVFRLSENNATIQFSDVRTFNKITLSPSKITFHGVGEIDSVWLSAKNCTIVVSEFGDVEGEKTLFAFEVHYVDADYSLLNISFAGLGEYTASFSEAVDGAVQPVDSIEELDTHDGSCYFKNASYFVAKLRHRIASDNVEIITSPISVHLSYTAPSTQQTTTGTTHYTVVVVCRYGENEYLQGVGVKVYDEMGVLQAMGETDQNGKFTCELPTGTYTFHARYGDTAKNQTLYVGEDMVVEFDFLSGQTLVQPPQPPKIAGLDLGDPTQAILLGIGLVLVVAGMVGAKRRGRRGKRGSVYDANITTGPIAW